MGALLRPLVATEPLPPRPAGGPTLRTPTLPRPPSGRPGPPPPPHPATFSGGPSTRCGGVKAASPASLTRQPPPSLKAQGSLWASGVVWEKLRLREEMGETAQGPPGQNPPPPGLPPASVSSPLQGAPTTLLRQLSPAPSSQISRESAGGLYSRLCGGPLPDDPCRRTTPAGWTAASAPPPTACASASVASRRSPALVPCEHGCTPQLSPPNFVQDCPPHTLPAALKCSQPRGSSPNKWYYPDLVLPGGHPGLGRRTGCQAPWEEGGTREEATLGLKTAPVSSTN